MTDLLTDEQIENWRRVLLGMIGPYALIMSKEDVQKYRNELQRRVNEGVEGDK